MKLNYDCVRDVLIALENDLVMDAANRMAPITAIEIIESHEVEMPYSLQEVEYTLRKLKEGEYIEASFSNKPMKAENESILYERSVIVTDITYKGHEYLNSIRDSKTWELIRKLGKSVALSTIPVIAEKIVLKMIT